jgi:hypothetical protein
MAACSNPALASFPTLENENRSTHTCLNMSTLDEMNNIVILA